MSTFRSNKIKNLLKEETILIINIDIPCDTY